MYRAGLSTHPPIQPGYRARILAIELVRPARFGPLVTVAAAVDPEAGLYRVVADGKEGRAYTVPLDISLSDPARASALIAHINSAAVAYVVSGIADVPTRPPVRPRKFLSTNRSS
jgi:hypothetical protein